MMLLWGLLPGLFLGLISGGRLRNLSSRQLRLEWLLIPLLVIASVLPSVRFAASDGFLVLVAWILPMSICVGAAVFNRSEPGFPVVLTGLICNLLVVASNGGMPVLAENAAVIAGNTDISSLLSTSWLHESVSAGTRLLMLADVIPIPGPVGLRGMASLGDLLIVIGIIQFVFVALHTQQSERINLK